MQMLTGTFSTTHSNHFLCREVMTGSLSLLWFRTLNRCLTEWKLSIKYEDRGSSHYWSSSGRLETAALALSRENLYAFSV